MSDKNFVGSLREIVQDLLVPELKAVKVEIAALRTDMKSSNEALRIDMMSSNEALRTDMNLSIGALRDELKIRIEASDRHTEQLIRALSDKLDFTIEVRERLASIEARMPRQ